MKGADPNDILAQDQRRAGSSVEHQAGQADIRRPLVTPRRVALVFVATAAVAMFTRVVASLGTFLGGIVLATVTALSIAALAMWPSPASRSPVERRSGPSRG